MHSALNRRAADRKHRCGFNRPNHQNVGLTHFLFSLRGFTDAGVSINMLRARGRATVIDNECGSQVFFHRGNAKTETKITPVEAQRRRLEALTRWFDFIKGKLVVSPEQFDDTLLLPTFWSLGGSGSGDPLRARQSARERTAVGVDYRAPSKSRRSSDSSWTDLRSSSTNVCGSFLC